MISAGRNEKVFSSLVFILSHQFRFFRHFAQERNEVKKFTPKNEAFSHWMIKNGKCEKWFSCFQSILFLYRKSVLPFRNRRKKMVRAIDIFRSIFNNEMMSRVMESIFAPSSSVQSQKLLFLLTPHRQRIRNFIFVFFCASWIFTFQFYFSTLLF